MECNHNHIKSNRPGWGFICVDCKFVFEVGSPAVPSNRPHYVEFLTTDGKDREQYFYNTTGIFGEGISIR